MSFKRQLQIFRITCKPLLIFSEEQKMTNFNKLEQLLENNCKREDEGLLKSIDIFLKENPDCIDLNYNELWKRFLDYEYKEMSNI